MDFQTGKCEKYLVTSDWNQSICLSSSIFFGHINRSRSKWDVECVGQAFVCVEVLRPSQPNVVMSSAVSLPNHNFTGQAESSKRLTSIVHILSTETDKFPFLNQLKGENDRRKYFMIKSQQKNVVHSAGVEPASS